METWRIRNRLAEIAVRLEGAERKASRLASEYSQTRGRDLSEYYSAKCGVLTAENLILAGMVRALMVNLNAPVEDSLPWPYEADSTEIVAALRGDLKLETDKDWARFFLAVAQYVENPANARALAGALREQARVLAENVGICPDCGGDVATAVWTEARPYGSTVAQEEMTQQYCPECELPPPGSRVVTN